MLIVICAVIVLLLLAGLVHWALRPAAPRFRPAATDNKSAVPNYVHELDGINTDSPAAGE